MKRERTPPNVPLRDSTRVNRGLDSADVLRKLRCVAMPSSCLLTLRSPARALGASLAAVADERYVNIIIRTKHPHTLQRNA